VDARLSAEQAELREAAAKLADDLGPHSVLDLSDAQRQARLEKSLASTGWRTLRSDGASGVEIALVAEELARGLVDVPFLGRVLADALRTSAGPATIAVGGVAVDAAGAVKALALDGASLLSAPVADDITRGVDFTRATAPLAGPFQPAGEISAAHAARWQALAIVVTAAELVGAARGAHSLAVEYAKVRAQYGHVIGSYQAISHLLAEGLALIEGSESVLRYAAWAVDELRPAEAINAARIAKAYVQVAARTVCETAIQVHGGIGNTWECLAHVYLRRVLAATELFPVRLEEIEVGLQGLRAGSGVPLQAARMARRARARLRDVGRRVLVTVRRVAPGTV
jgi:alkylation response protein AidB-like acyl-CoA dehydrogenase